MTNFKVSYINQDFPSGTGPVASITAALTDTKGAVTPLSIALGSTTASASIPPDTYTYTIENLDAVGNTLGQIFAGTFVSTVPVGVTLSLANGLTVGP
jgi:hypothetical protein